MDVKIHLIYAEKWALAYSIAHATGERQHVLWYLQWVPDPDQPIGQFLSICDDTELEEYEAQGFVRAATVNGDEEFDEDIDFYPDGDIVIDSENLIRVARYLDVSFFDFRLKNGIKL